MTGLHIQFGAGLSGVARFPKVSRARPIMLIADCRSMYMPFLLGQRGRQRQHINAPVRAFC